MRLSSLRRATFVACLIAACHHDPGRAATSSDAIAQDTAARWTSSGGTTDNRRFADLPQLTPAAVRDLERAWTFHTGEADSLRRMKRWISLEATPVLVAGRLIVSTPLGQVIALDPETGTERWRVSLGVSTQWKFGNWHNRGVTAWEDSTRAATALCRWTIFAVAIDARLFALDAVSGERCRSFARDGVLDLRLGLRMAPQRFEAYGTTSPPVVVRGVAVMGSSVADEGGITPASGEVRGFDARTGRLLWSWDPVPAADSANGDWQGSSVRLGGGNVWSLMAADEARGLVFLPTSSASADHFGGGRQGPDRHANSVVALDARTGAMRWAFQTVHHDLWDYDNASPPVLTTIPIDGQPRDVVLQANKTGMLFVLDRDTGVPVWPVEEREVPASDVHGERAAATQPFSPRAILSRHSVREEDIWGLTPWERRACLREFRTLRHEGIFTPPSTRGTLIIPGHTGGFHWGGSAIDVQQGLLIAPINTFPSVVQLVRRGDTLPSPLVRAAEIDTMAGTDYVLRRRFWTSPGGLPCIRPPWGELVAMELATGTVRWRIPLGSTGEVLKRATGLPIGFLGPKGSPTLGGPLTTAGGVTFIAATTDSRLRAFETATGRLVWDASLPSPAKAAPMAYTWRGHQYVVVAAGGDGTPVFGVGDAIVAFRLP